jgi:hypothetical protein
MFEYNDGPPEGKHNQDRDADDGADLAVFIIAARFGLTHSLARVVCERARIGGCDDRATAGKIA